MNPAASVRGPKYVVKRGKTPVLTADQARKLLDSIKTDSLVGLRDRALIGVMVYGGPRGLRPTGRAGQHPLRPRQRKCPRDHVPQERALSGTRRAEDCHMLAPGLGRDCEDRVLVLVPILLFGADGNGFEHFGGGLLNSKGGGVAGQYGRPRKPSARFAVTKAWPTL